MTALLTDHRIWVCPDCPGQTVVTWLGAPWWICGGHPVNRGHLYPRAMHEVALTDVDPLWLAKEVKLL